MITSREVVLLLSSLDRSTKFILIDSLFTFFLILTYILVVGKADDSNRFLCVWLRSFRPLLFLLSFFPIGTLVLVWLLQLVFVVRVLFIVGNHHHLLAFTFNNARGSRVEEEVYLQGAITASSPSGVRFL